MRPLLLFILLFAACTDSNKADIITVLDLRDAAISQQDIGTYSMLLSDAYFAAEGADKVVQMKEIFKRFDSVNMKSRDREIRLLEGHKAICEQTYVLKIFADKEWREIVQREQLKLELIDGTWKITAGL